MLTASKLCLNLTFTMLFIDKKKSSVILKAYLVVGQDDKGAATGRLHDDGQELRVHGTERRVP